MITGIFMASGSGSRMGQNKLLLPFRDAALFRHGLEAACRSSIDRLTVVSGHEEILSFCAENGICHIFNSNASEGQSASIRLGVSFAEADSSYIFIPADQPFLTAEFIDSLISAGKEYPESIIIPKYRNSPGSPTVFPSHLREELLALTGDVGGKAIIRTHPELVRYREIPDCLLLTDIDTPEDYSAHNKHLR